MTIEDTPKIEVMLEYRCPIHKNEVHTQIGFLDKRKRLLIEDMYKKYRCDECDAFIDVPAESMYIYFSINDEYIEHVQYRMKNPLKL